MHDCGNKNTLICLGMNKYIANSYYWTTPLRDQIPSQILMVFKDVIYQAFSVTNVDTFDITKWGFLYHYEPDENFAIRITHSLIYLLVVSRQHSFKSLVSFVFHNKNVGNIITNFNEWKYVLSVVLIWGMSWMSYSIALVTKYFKYLESFYLCLQLHNSEKCFCLTPLTLLD